MKTNYTGFFTVLCLSLLLATACGKKVQETTTTATPSGVPFGVNLPLPRDLKNAESQPTLLKASAVVISTPTADEFFIGKEQFPRDALSDVIEGRLKGQPPADRVVYVASSLYLDHGHVLKILESARLAGVDTIALLVERPAGKTTPSLFKVKLLPEPKIDDMPPKPDPLALLVSIEAGDKVQLNQKPMGNATDTSSLVQALTAALQQRKENEKSVVIKASRSTVYNQVVHLIDAARGAGANQIILQLDDLPL